MNEQYIALLTALRNRTLSLDALQDKKILVTGATGLIGSCFIDFLMLCNRCEVYAMNRNASSARTLFKRYIDSPNFHLLTQDVSMPLQCDVAFDYIIHAAGNATPKSMSTDPVGTMKANFIGLDNLLGYAAQHHTRMVYLSSGEIYGQGSGESFSEEDYGSIPLLSVRACYPSSKRAAETLCCSYAAQYGVHVSIARPCYIFGPTFQASDNRVFVQFCENVLQGHDIVMKSDGSATRSYCFVLDCVEALLYILLKGETAQAYNISGPTTTIRQLAEAVAKAGQKKVIVDCPPTPLTGTSPVNRSVLNGAKLAQLGWQWSYSLEEAVRLSLQIIQNR